MLDDPQLRHELVPMDPRFAWAIRAFATVSFLTTVSGVASIGPAFQDEPVFAIAWWVVSVCLAGGISLSIAAMSFQLWERVTLPRLAAVIGLATVAVVFDASFFQREYARFDLAENAGLAHWRAGSKSTSAFRQRAAPYARVCLVIWTSGSPQPRRAWRRRIAPRSTSNFSTPIPRSAVVALGALRRGSEPRVSR